MNKSQLAKQIYFSPSFLEVAKFLLDKGATFNTRDRDGKLAVDLAEERGHLDVAQSILATYSRHSLLITQTSR